MSKHGIVATLLSALFFSSVLVRPAAQEQNVASTRNTAALSVLRAAVQRMGGEEAIARVRDCISEGHFEAGNSGFEAGTFAWKNSGKDFRYERSAAAGKHVVVSGHGRPRVSRNGKVRKLFLHTVEADLPAQLAAALLLERLQDLRFEVDLLDPVPMDNVVATRVRTRMSSDKLLARITEQTWYFDPSGLPVKVDYNAPATDDANWITPVSIAFSEFSPYAGAVIPRRLSYYIGNTSAGTASITNFSCGVPITDADFDDPAGGQ